MGEDRNSDRKWKIWEEGYAVTGGYGKAHCLGTVLASTFKEACIKYAALNPDWAKSFRIDDLTNWGCRLYDNSEDARRTFG